MNMKVALTGAGLGFLGAINSYSISVFNVPLTTVWLAFFGAMASYAYQVDENKEQKRDKKFWFALIVNTFTAVTAVTVVPAMFGWEWYNTKMENSMAFLFALGARFVIPLVFKSLPELVRKWFRIGEYKSQPKENKDETEVTK